MFEAYFYIVYQTFQNTCTLDLLDYYNKNSLRMPKNANFTNPFLELHDHKTQKNW